MAKACEIENTRYCGDCRYWRFAGDDYGHCRINPPVIVRGMIGATRDVDYAVWPKTDCDDLCGKFEEA